MTGGDQWPPTREQYSLVKRYADVSRFYDYYAMDTEEHVFDSLAAFLVDVHHLAESAAIYVLKPKPEDSYIVLAAHSGAPELPAELSELSKGVQSTVGRCIDRQQRLIIRDWSSYEGRSRIFPEPQSGSGVCTPLASGGECVGAICLHSSQAEFFNDQDGEVIATLGGMAATIVTRIRAQAEAEQSATHDYSTGLLNRYGLIRMRLEQVQVPVNQRRALLVIDIDDFKRFNEMGYQDFGDRVIREVGNVLRLWISDAGPLARWGGDEFLAMMVLAEGDWLPRYEVLRRRVADMHDAVTLSVGVDWWDDGSFDHSRSHALDALTFAKKCGKDRAIIFGPDMPKPPEPPVPLGVRILRQLGVLRQ